MIQKLTKATTRLLAILFAMFATSGAWADFAMTNPVTGATESYTYKFIGTDSVWNNAANWKDSNSSSPSAVPAASGSDTWAPILFDQAENQSIVIGAVLSVEGWNLRMGLYNGASVTLKNLKKLQGGVGMWITVDSSSHCTIEAMANKKLANANPLCLYSANEGGIAWTQELSSSGNESGDTAMPFHYYLAGNGTVAYNGGIAAAAGGAHVIKQADVTLSGTSQVSSKTLVSFTSSYTTFTADAAIKVYDGTTLKETVAVTSVRSSGAAIQNTTSALTTADAVGTCELVQCTDGIVLYYVDGDPSAVVAKTYTPSININFTSGTALSTAADVGLAGYAVPGTSWNNLSVANNATLSSLNKIDSTGAATASSASVTITNTRGEWHCSSLVATSDLRAGYIDETSAVTTPTVTVSGIPYDQYKVVVYTATDAANVAFGYVTINGTDYTYANGAVAEGTAAWGASGAQNTAEALAEGVNVLVSPVVSGATLTVVGHRSGNNPRGCIAAVQIVKVEQQVGENDLLIELNGNETYTFNEAKTYSGTVYVTGSGTLTFAGTASTAATLHIGPAAAVNMTGSALTPTAVTGNGTVVYDGAQPSTTLGFDNSANWQGTVWVKNVGDTSKGEAETAKVTTCLGSNTTDATSNNLNKWGSAASFVKFTNVRGYMATANVPWTLILEDDSSNYAWYNNEGWTARTITIAGLKGDGTFWDVNDGGTRPFLNFTDASQFTGSINVTGKQVFLSGAGTGNASDLSAGRITIPANQTLTVASGKTWHTRNGLVVNGTLNVTGTLTSDSTTAAVSGSGTVVFTGRAPTPTGDAWWKNAAWTGTVEIKNYSFNANIYLGTYGNSGSKVCMNGSEAYLHVLNNPDHNIAELVIGAGGFTQDGTYSSGTVTFTLPFKVTGTGVYTLSAGGNATKIVNLTGDLSEFAGYLSPTGANTRFVVGSTTRDFVAKSVVIGSGKVLSMGNFNAGPDGGLFIDEGGQVIILDSGFLWTTGGVTVDGTLTTSSRANRIGGGTAITLGDNGVLEITGNNANESTAAYSNISGTGSIKYSGSGYLVLSANYPTDIPLIDEKGDALVVPAAGATIGSLSGTKGFRSDWSDTPVEGRYLTIKQAKDTSWSGSINQISTHRLTGVVVDPGESTTGTLEVTGTQTASATLTVNGSVNLTGTWVGATTVAGTFGGTGTLTGNLTFNAGSTFKAFVSDENGLAVSGTVAYPEEGTVTVDVSDLTLSSSGTTLITFTSAPSAEDIASKMAPSSGAFLKLDGSTLKAYPLVATYNNENYATIAEAIAAAVEDGHTYADVTILDATATCPDGYYIDTENSNALTMYQAAIVKKNDAGKDYFKTGQLAFDAIATADTYFGVYDYVEIYYGTGVEVSVNPAAIVWTYGSDPVRIKCFGGATVTVSLASTESTLTAGAADENGIVTYTKTDIATTYVWAGGTTLSPWSSPNKWKVGTLAGATATRKPGALDTVQIGDGAKVSDIVGSLSVAALQVSGTVTFTGGGSLTSASAITLGASDTTISLLTGTTLSPTPTTNVAHYRVKTVTSGDTTTYSVEAIPGTTFTVY